MQYIWQKDWWPQFRYCLKELEPELIRFAQIAGQIDGASIAINEADRNDTLAEVMIQEAVKTSEIEGLYLNRPDVASSIRNQLGINQPAVSVRNPSARGIAELLINLRSTWDNNLDREMLFNWHVMIFRGTAGIEVGSWRTHREPMQVLSGTADKRTVLLEAPSSESVPREMDRFIEWFNSSRQEIVHAPVRAALAHLYFETIHPFEDGNGRIGRAISEKAIAQGLGKSIPLSLSRAIEASRSDYYSALCSAQQADDATPWITYFTGIAIKAQEMTMEIISFVIKKARFFDKYGMLLKERQMKVIQRMFAEGPGGFEGGMNARKYTAITEASKATATRDLQELVGLDILIPRGGGRSTSYDLNLPTNKSPVD